MTPELIVISKSKVEVVRKIAFAYLFTRAIDKRRVGLTREFAVIFFRKIIKISI